MTIASPEIFGARIRRVRKSQGLTITQLSIKAGVPGHNAVNRMENADNEPGLFKAARVAAALGVSLDTLLAPPECGTCDGLPPAGFICPDCKTRGGTR